ncbi:MAG: hypothetical protein ACP5O7_12150, partial [Phycisphaerae bacterium]
MFSKQLGIKRTLVAGALVAVVAMGASAVNAGVVNIGDGVTGTDPTGLTGVPEDPNRIGTGSDISVSVNGSGSVTSNVLLAILIPNNENLGSATNFFGSSDPIIAVTAYPDYSSLTPTSTGSSAFTGTGFGLGGGSAAYQGSGFWGLLPSTGSLNSLLGTSFNASNNTSNFSGFDSGLGLPGINSWGVYTLKVTSGALSPSKGSKPLARQRYKGSRFSFGWPMSKVIRKG